MNLDVSEAGKYLMRMVICSTDFLLSMGTHGYMDSIISTLSLLIHSLSFS